MIKDKIQIIKKYKKAYKDYFIVLLKIYFNRKNFQKDNIMIKVKLKDGKKMNIPYEWVCRFAYLNTYPNKYFSNLSLTKDGNNIFIEIKLKDGKKLNVNYEIATKFLELNKELNKYPNKNISNLSLTEDGISFYYKGHRVIISPLDNGDIEGVFFKEIYDFLQI